MKISGSYVFDAPAPKVWAVLMDPKALAHCIPGCEGFTETGIGQYRAVVSAGIGPVRGRYQVGVTLADLVPPKSYRLVVEGTSSSSFASGEARVTLVDQGNKTTVKVDSETQAGGVMARVGQRLMGNAAQTMMQKFFSCLQQSMK